MDHLPIHITDWITTQVNKKAEVKEVVRLQGSTSSDLYSVQLCEEAHEINLVLRLLTNQEWLQNEPDLAEHET